MECRRCTPAWPSPDIIAIFNRFSKEELHQIGLALIQQSQYPVQKQQQFHHPPGSSIHSPRHHLPTRPPLENVSSIPPLMNHHHQHRSKVRPLMEQQSTLVSTSTPRRPASDSFDNSGENYQRTTIRVRNNDQSPRKQQSQRQPQHLTLIPPHPHYPFNINALKRAVSNNLPCFFITFDLSIDTNNIPSCTQVAIMLKKLFINNQLLIKELSMCVQAGERRFKFAVGDKADFLTLFNWNWPFEIEDKKVQVNKPHSLLDCYSSVVRYIPLDVKQETARCEVMKAIPAATGFSAINYQHHQRPSYDLRFNVRNLDQYQTALELGRLSIGHYYLPLTNFLTGYRLTYCTACWKLGHMRDKCQSPICCRKCLVPFTNCVKHSCQSTVPTCAQCGGDHLSLDSACPIVKRYREDLKAAVDKALAAGAIKRPPPGELSRELSRPFQQYANDFPELTKAHVSSRPIWIKPTNEILHSNLKKEVSELTVAIKALSDTVVHTEKNFNEINRRIEIQDKRTMLHCNSISVVIDTLHLLSKWVRASNNERSKLKKNINKSVEDLQKLKQKSDPNKNNESTPSTSSLQPNTTTNIVNNNNEWEVEFSDDLSMNSLEQDA